MKDFKDIKVIGIDHGYGNIKTANTVTPTGITAYDTQPIFAGCSIYPQGYPAIIDILPDFKGTNLLCDIGNGTMNLLYFRDKKPQETRCWTEKIGVNQCMIRLLWVRSLIKARRRWQNLIYINPASIRETVRNYKNRLQILLEMQPIYLDFICAYSL